MGRTRALQTFTSQASIRPVPEDTPHGNELPQVIGVVIRNEQRLSKIRLACPMWNCSQEIEAGIGEELLQRLPVAAERGN